MQGHFTSQWVLIEKWIYSESCWISKIEHFGKIIISFNYFCKTHHLKSLWGFRICLSFKYVRFLNVPEFPVCQGYEFPGLHRQGSECALGCNCGRFLNIPGFRIGSFQWVSSQKKKFFFQISTMILIHWDEKILKNWWWYLSPCRVIAILISILVSQGSKIEEISNFEWVWWQNRWSLVSGSL